MQATRAAVGCTSKSSICWLDEAQKLAQTYARHASESHGVFQLLEGIFHPEMTKPA
jgi:hypothetical protein